MDLESQRRYADIGTQTSPLTFSNLAESSSIHQNIFTAARPRVANPAHLDFSTFEGSPEREERISPNKYMSLSESPSFERPQPLLPSFPSSFGLQRYTTSSRPNPSTNRSVSLPEALHDEDLRLVLSQLTDHSSPEVREQPRVVSMPESLQLHTQRYATAKTYDYREHEATAPSPERTTYDGIGVADNEDLHSSSSTPSTPGTIVMHSLSSDQFRTPSPPPSSCDSVEFTLEDLAHVPDSFLRGSSPPPLKAAGLVEDDGWLTWANSPPRPIPALHGPSSLPYARCPSGAEGTIIGEPSSLPRMIWGLDPNDAVPTSHVPPSQSSRSMSIKPPAGNFKSRYSPQQGLASTVSTPAVFGSLHVGPRFGSQNMNHNSFEQRQCGREFSRSTPTILDVRREEDLRNFRRVTNGGLDLSLNATLHEEPIRLETRYEHDDGIMDYSHLHAGRMGPAATLDRDFELLPVEKESQRQPPSSVRIQEEIHMQHPYGSGSKKGRPSNLIELLSSPVNLLDRASHAYCRIAPGTPRLSAQTFTPSFLPTPPSSSSPQWSSVFSPLRNKCPSAANFPHCDSNSSSEVVLQQQKNTNEELSDDLRRFVFENMSPISSATTTDTFQAFPIPRTSATNVFLTACNSEGSLESPAHPPGLPIPQHILLSKALEPFDPLSTQGSTSPKFPPPSPSTYTRSTLSNPRSIPLSRLRQKRSAIKLATVPEEDSAEPQLHDGRLTPQGNVPLRVFLRTPSPLDGRLHARSMDEKPTFEEDLKPEHARVKLPNSKGSAQCANLGHSENATSQGSPKKKRLQRRKKFVRAMESVKSGFPLINEDTIWFGPSNPSVTPAVREDQLTLGCASSGKVQSMGKVFLDKHNTAAGRSDKG